MSEEHRKKEIEWGTKHQELIDEVDGLKLQKAALNAEIDRLGTEVKRLKLQQLDGSKYIQWRPDEIAAWIVDLDPNRMNKYETILGKGLVENEVKGALLAEVDGGDLKEWGIDDRKDRKYVMAEIERLVANNTRNESAKIAMREGANAASTAFM